VKCALLGSPLDRIWTEFGVTGQNSVRPGLTEAVALTFAEVGFRGASVSGASIVRAVCQFEVMPARVALRAGQVADVAFQVDQFGMTARCGAGLRDALRGE
jgi:hypothetical protein